MVVALKQMYDLYGVCAGLHIELIKAITIKEQP
nr:MAG TPA: hypothetical protein [Caudoviricetes sp.]